MIDRRSGLAATLLGDADVLAAETARRHLAADPSLAERFGPAAHPRCVEDGVFHLKHLAAAVSVDRPVVFREYVGWAASLFTGLGIEPDELRDHLATLVEVVAERVGPEDAAVVRSIVTDSLSAMDAADGEPASHLDPGSELGRLAGSFLNALLDGDRREAARIVLEAADGGAAIEDLYLQVFQPCLREVGRLWQLGRASVAQEHFVTAATQVVMAQLYPRLFATPRIGRSVVVACVGGELHEVGGRMVADVFELRGWDSRFVGANAPGRSVADLAATTGADVVAISATLPSHLPKVEDAVAAVRAATAARVLVGGRPFGRDLDLWKLMGADGSAPDAAAAVEVATNLLEGDRGRG